jgi:hypothetical protein
MTGEALANRGRVTGSLLMLLGAWGAIIPFVGPYFGYAYTPDTAWAYTSGRLWLSVVPGAAVVLGGMLVVFTDGVAAPAAFLAALGGTWFVVGAPVIALALPGRSISPGTPVINLGAVFHPATMVFLERLGFFYGLGVLILFLAAFSLGEVVVARMAASRYRDRMYEAVQPEDEYGQAW